MSILDIEKVDMISINNKSQVVLSVSDHLDWNDIEDHLILIQNKLNYYLHFIETGQLADVNKNYSGKPILIRIFMKFYYPDEASFFFKQLEAVLSDSDIGLVIE